MGWVRKYDAMATELWTTTHAGPLPGTTARAVAIDGNGDIVVTGHETSASDGDDVWLAKLAP